MIDSGLALSVHDVSDGGLLVAATEMALASRLGLEVNCDFVSCLDLLFGEDQARYLIETDDFERLVQLASAAGLSAECFGKIGGSAIAEESRIDGVSRLNVPLTALREASDSFFRDWMEG